MSGIICVSRYSYVGYKAAFRPGCRKSIDPEIKAVWSLQQYRRAVRSVVRPARDGLIGSQTA